MKQRGQVKSIEIDRNILYDEVRRVTIDLKCGDRLVMTLKPHEAKPYTLGRYVDIEIKPDKK